MPSSRHLARRIPAGAAAAALCCGLIAATCSQPEGPVVVHPPKLLPAPTPEDLGRRAYDHVATLVGFGPRFTGSPGWQRGLDHIAETLTEAGLEPVRDRWTDPRFGIEFENIHATIPGRHKDRIILACHHDTKKCEGHPDPAHNFPFVGANDSGSGVGTLLALVPALMARDNQATIQVVFFDGEESLDFKWDMDKALFGSKRFAAAEKARELDPDASKLRALVLLDMVGARDLQIDEEEYSDRDLREIFRGAAAACGHQDVFFQKSQPVRDDHLPFLERGFPAIDLIDLIDNPQWHTAEDTLDHIAAESMQIVGEVVLTALPAIERQYFPQPLDPQSPRQPPPSGGER